MSRKTTFFGSIFGPQTSFPPFFRVYRVLSHIPTSNLWSSNLWSSDLWVVGIVAFGLVGRRTYGHRTCGPSDLWTSDLWAVGLVGLRTCDMSPFIFIVRRVVQRSSFNFVDSFVQEILPFYHLCWYSLTLGDGGPDRGQILIFRLVDQLF